MLQLQPWTTMPDKCKIFLNVTKLWQISAYYLFLMFLNLYNGFIVMFPHMHIIYFDHIHPFCYSFSSHFPCIFIFSIVIIALSTVIYNYLSRKTNILQLYMVLVSLLFDLHLQCTSWQNSSSEFMLLTHPLSLVILSQFSSLSSSHFYLLQSSACYSLLTNVHISKHLSHLKCTCRFILTHP
jgi:hypothetical protein